MQTSKVSAPLLPPPSKVAATETVQPFIFGSLPSAAFGASGFESLVVLSPAVMTMPVAVFAVALMTGTEEGGPFRFGFGFGFGFGAAVSGVAAASPGAEPGTAVLRGTGCDTGEKGCTSEPSDQRMAHRVILNPRSPALS